MTESITCHKYENIVFDHQDSIFCDCCYTWLHRKCLKMSYKQFTSLSHDNEPWFCNLCLTNHLPYFNLSTQNLLSLSYNSLTIRKSKQNLKHVSLHKHDTKKFCCSTCTKQVKNLNKSLFCNLCSHYIHHKCTELPKYHIKRLNKKLWKCLTCNNFSFQNVENTEFLMLNNFNSLVDNDYTNSQLNDLDTRFLSELPALEIFQSIHNQLSSQNDMDIDNHLTIKNNFSFYNLHDFHKLCSNNLYNKSNALSFLHSNIRSYQKNIEQLETLLDQLGHSFDIIGLTELWNNRKNNDSFLTVKLNGYHSFEHLPGTSQNSGCGLYITNNITYHCREDLSKSFSITGCEFEALWVEIINKKGPNILIAIIYRHPGKSDIKSFLHYLEQCFNKLRAENKIVTIMGDFNLDLLNCDSHTDTNDFLAMILSIFLQPHIIQPTHFLPSGKSTLIDNIFINSLEYECTSGNYIPHVTDHLPNFIFIKKFQFSKS